MFCDYYGGIIYFRRSNAFRIKHNHIIVNIAFNVHTIFNHEIKPKVYFIRFNKIAQLYITL